MCVEKKTPHDLHVIIEIFATGVVPCAINLGGRNTWIQRTNFSGYFFSDDSTKSFFVSAFTSTTRSRLPASSICRASTSATAAATTTTSTSLTSTSSAATCLQFSIMFNYVISWSTVISSILTTNTLTKSTAAARRAASKSTRTSSAT